MVPRADPRAALAAAAALLLAAGCRKRPEIEDPPSSPGGPEIQVRLAVAPELALLLPGRVRVSSVEAGALVFEGEAPRDADGTTRLRCVEGGVAMGEHVLPKGIEIQIVGDGDGGGDGAPPRARLSDLPGALLPGRRSEMEPKRFRGHLLVLLRGDELELANRLGIEEYLLGVVGAEMPASVSPLEALKAQAVAARTYAFHAILEAAAKGRRPIFGGDEGFQVYGGVGWEHPRSTRAVRETSGEVLTFRGQVFRAYYHAACGGRTVPAYEVFLEPRIEPLQGAICGACDAPWETAYTPQEIALALRGWLESRRVRLGEVTSVEVAETWPEGRARWVRVLHSRGSLEIDANRFRALTRSIDGVGLRSTSFRVESRGSAFAFHGSGRGHGVGLCQMGASHRGRTETYREILRWYYPGSDVDIAYGGTPVPF